MSVGPRGLKFTMGVPACEPAAASRALGFITALEFLPWVEQGGGRNPPGPSSSRKGKTLNPTFFRRLFIPEGEESLIDGCRELVMVNRDLALDHFRKAAHLADGAWLAGCLCLQKGLLAEAEHHLKEALERRDELVKILQRHGIQATMVLPVTDELEALVGLGERGPWPWWKSCSGWAAGRRRWSNWRSCLNSGQRNWWRISPIR